MFTVFPVEKPDPFEGLLDSERWISPEGRGLWSALLSSAGSAQMEQRAWENLSGAPTRSWLSYGDFHPFDQRSIERRSPLALLAYFKFLATRSRELNDKDWGD